MITPDLLELRRGIDQIDEDIVRLLNQRAALVLDVKRAKEKDKIDVYSPERERQIIDRVIKLSEGGAFPQSALEKIFSNIISATRSLIGELCVSYVGPECSLAHEAAVKQFGETLRYNPELSVEEVCAKVELGESDFGVVPAHNSAVGMVSKTFDLLMQSKLLVIAEVAVKERLALLSRKASLAELKKVYSDAYSFTRTMDWIKANLPGVELLLADNLSAAAKIVAGSDEAAVIASESFSESFSLNVLVRGLESEQGNSDARFLVLGRKMPEITGHDKTSLICAVEDRAGALMEILKPFAEKGITLLKIESRPMRNRAWEYVFFIDFVGHQADATVKQAVDQLSKLCSYLKVLGSYPLVCSF